MAGGGVRVEVVGVPTVTGPAGTVSGAALGGRRAQVVLVALAVEGGALTASRLAELVWRGRPPGTWPVALRGVVRGLRTAATGAGIGDQELVATVPGGYRLAPEVEVDLVRTARTLEEADRLVGAGRGEAALTALAPLTRLRGADLLPGEDQDWLRQHRAHVDELAVRAREVTVNAALGAGQAGRAVAEARDWVASSPLDERGHRALVQALDAAGDRAGAVQAFEACRALLADELGLDPAPETVAAYLHALGEPTAVRRATVPRTTTSFVGRDAEYQTLRDAADQPGVVTLLGPGGVGKSRLSAEVLRRERDRFPVVHWVAVESAGRDELLPASLAFAVGVDPGDDPLEAVLTTLSPLGRVVLVLDGAEGTLDGAASAVGELARRCPQLTVLATSRAPLGLPHERLVPLQPWVLSEPEETDDPMTRLLLDRITERGGRLTPDQRTSDLVRSVLDRTAGLPLAIELVAAQLAVTSPGDLADQFDDLLDTATDPVRGIARSAYAALSTDEAALFRRFAVLEGPVPLWLAREVVADDTVPRARVLRLLGALASYGLLREDRTAERWRWRQDDELQRYGRELLAERDEKATTLHRLAAAMRAQLPDDPRSPPGSFAATITDVLPSVRSLFNAALAGEVEADSCLELAFRLHRYWAASNVGEGRFWLTRLLETAGPSGEWEPYATYALGYLEYWSGDGERAIARLRKAADLLLGVDDQYVARALVFLAGLLDDTDRPREAVATLREALEIVEDFEPQAQMPAVMGLGSLLSERGDPEAAEHAVRAIELCRAPGTTEQLTIALPTAAMICWQVGAVDQAQAFVDEALPLHKEPRISRVVLYSAAAGVALDRGDLAAAEELATTADREGTELGVERELPLVRCILARARLGAGDPDGAAEAVVSALEGGLAMAHDFPLALGLETASLVLAAQGAGTEDERRRLVATAAQIRARGDRPAPHGMSIEATYQPYDGEVEEPRAAARLAVKLLTR